VCILHEPNTHAHAKDKYFDMQSSCCPTRKMPIRPWPAFATRHHTATRREQIWNLNTLALHLRSSNTLNPNPILIHALDRHATMLGRASTAPRTHPPLASPAKLSSSSHCCCGSQHACVSRYHVSPSPSPIYPSLTQPPPAARCASPPASCAPLRCLSSSRQRRSCPLPPSLPPPPPAR